MATRHTEWPEPAGERELAIQLMSIDDPHLHFWFGMNHIPNVRDVDILVYHERAGIFVIEVKAVPLSMVEEFGYNTCLIQGRSRDKGPRDQANKAMITLRETIGHRLRKAFFITSTACWPKIQRRTWNDKWDDDRVCGEYADRMVFREDCYSDPNAFVERLSYISDHPLTGETTAWPFRHSTELFSQLVSALQVTAKQKPSISDLERLRSIEDRVKKQAVSDAPANETRSLLYTGGPGTGKTFRLLQIAYLHAMNEKSTLYLCFNKVLASDIKRLLNQSVNLKTAGAFIEVRDVFDILRLYDQDLVLEGGSYDTWAQMVVDDMKSRPGSVNQYDTILVDEAQDLAPWAFDLISLHSKAQSTICIAAGKGQELYKNSKSAWFSEFSRTATPKPLRRNFRNTEPVFKFAQTFYEAYGKEPGQIAKTLAKFKSTNPAVQLSLPEFERATGALPSLQAIDWSHLEKNVNDESLYADTQERFMSMDTNESSNLSYRAWRMNNGR